MRVTIWSHFRDETWTGDVPDHLIDGANDPVAVNEVLFRLFNRVTALDSVRLEDWGYRLPSLSVEDRVTHDGRTYEVRNVGFAEVTNV